MQRGIQMKFFVIVLGIITGLMVTTANSPFTALIMVAAAMLTAAIFSYPQVGIISSIFTIWLEHGLLNYNPTVTLTKMIVIVTAFSLGFNMLVKKVKWAPVKIFIPLFLLLIAMLISDFYSPYPNNGLLKLRTFVTQLTIIFLIVQGFRELKWLKITLGGLVLISGFQAVQSFFVMKTADVHDGIVRLSGNYQDPNVFARGLLTALTICILFWVLNKKFWPRLIALALSLLFMGAIFFTGSRSSVVISFVVLFLIFALFLRTQGLTLGRLSKQISLFFIIIILNLTMGYFLIDYVPKAYTQRIMTLIDLGLSKTASKDGRALLFYAAAETISENPVMGIGLSGFRTYAKGIVAIYPHNILLETWAEVGLAGFLILCTLIIMTFWLGYQSMLKNRGSPQYFQQMMMLIAGYLVNLTYAQSIGQITSHKPLWIFMGLILALEQIKPAGKKGES